MRVMSELKMVDSVYFIFIFIYFLILGSRISVMSQQLQSHNHVTYTRM